MKLPTCDKTSSYGKKPHIRKGYYPAKLMKVEPFADSQGNLKEGKYGRQLIFEFAIYKADPESGQPIEPMTYVPDEDNSPNVIADVIIPKFVYHEYKTKTAGEFQTAITPNSAITRILKALGWTFSTKDVDTDPMIGRWVEVNVDEYEQSIGEGEKYTASTIKDISSYKGPEIGDIREATKKEPQEVNKKVKHEKVKEKAEKKKPEESKEITKIQESITHLENLNKEGLLTDGGLKQSKEQLESKIEELRKK